MFCWESHGLQLIKVSVNPGYIDIYTTKIDGVVCQPNISETVAGRLMKLAHRPRIASTMIKNSLQNQLYCSFY